MLKRILWCFLFVPLVAGLVHAQYSVNTTDIHYFDNSPNYTLHNLWHPMAGTPQLVNFSSSRGADFNSFMSYGVDPVGNAWAYSESQDSSGFHSAWSQAPNMGTDNKLIAVGHGQIWKLTKSGCAGSNFNIKQWGYSGSWIGTIGGCGVDLQVAEIDGTPVTVNAAGQIFYGTSTGWVQLTGGGPYVSVTALSSTQIFANTSTGLIYRRDPAGTNTMVPSGIPTTPSTSGHLTIGGDGNLWFLSSGTGHAYTYQNGAWVQPLGYAFSQISTSGLMQTFGIVGGNLYRFTELGLQWTISTSGVYNCPQGGCPNGSSHTPIADIEFASGSLGHAHVVGTAGSAAEYISANATAKSWDSFSCIFEGFSVNQCLASGSSGAVNCTVMGQIFGSSVFGGQGGFPPIALIPIPRFEFCQATFKKVSKVSGSCKTELGFVLCDYTGTPYCTAAKTPNDDQPLGAIPPYYFHDMLQSSADANGAFFHIGVCTRMTSLTGINLTNWYNVLSVLPGAVSTPDVGPGSCTGPNNRP